MTATPNNPLSPATSASDTEQRYHAGGAFAMKEQALETASNVQQASGEAVVLDTTGTGIPTVETHDGLAKLVVSVDAACSTIERLAAELARVHAQRDALAEACRAVLEGLTLTGSAGSHWAVTLRSALSTGGGK